MGRALGLPSQSRNLRGVTRQLSAMWAREAPVARSWYEKSSQGVPMAPIGKAYLVEEDMHETYGLLDSRPYSREVRV